MMKSIRPVVLSIDVDFTKPKKPGAGISGGASSGTTKSDYNSVTDQSGIYAGEGGFNITVDKNTDLKGGVIDSDATPDKNKLTTGTLTWEDVDNKAEYSSKDVGINVNINNGAKDNEKGVTPNIGMPAKGEDESTTKAGVAQGNIEIKDKENQKQNIEDLNRDTKNTLNKLEQLFDKQTVAERKEMAALFGELAYNVVHNIDGTPEQKAALHALVGGIMSELTGSGFLAGASGAAVNKLLSDELKKIAGDDPALHQWLSAALGAVVSDVVAGNAQAGSSTAASGTKNNDQLDAELAAQEGKTSQEVIEADKMNAYESVEETILKQYGVDNIYKLSVVEQEQVIQQCADVLNISKDEARFIQNTKSIVEGSISVGVGLGGSVSISSITGKAVINGHIEGSSDDDVKVVGELALYLQAKGILKIGGELKYNYYPKTKVVRVDNFVGLDTPYGTIGINNIPEEYDFIMETGFGGYVVSGGEIKGKINMTEFYKQYIK